MSKQARRAERKKEKGSPMLGIFPAEKTGGARKIGGMTDEEWRKKVLDDEEPKTKPEPKKTAASSMEATQPLKAAVASKKAASPEPKKAAAPQGSKKATCSQPSNGLPGWAEKTIDKLVDVSQQLTDLMTEDHQVIIDHEYRLRALEERTDALEWADWSGGAATQPEPQPEEVTQPQPRLSLRKEPLPGTIPAKLYEFWDIEDQKWRGPVTTRDLALSMVHGLEPYVRPAYVWFDPDLRIVVGYMPNEAKMRYFAMS